VAEHNEQHHRGKRGRDERDHLVRVDRDSSPEIEPFPPRVGPEPSNPSRRRVQFEPEVEEGDPALDQEDHESRDRHRQADGADDFGRLVRLGKVAKYDAVQEQAKEWREDEQRQHSSKHHGYAEGGVELEEEPPRREGDAARSEVEDAGGRVGEDESSRDE
jgi:hypothetical protein